MRIGIDARGVNWYKGTGIGTYTDKILRYLINNHKENFYNIFWSGENYDSFNLDNTKILMASKKHHRFFEQIYFPENLKKEKIDIYHIPQNGIGISENIYCKKVVTIHDLIPYVLPETVGKGYLNKFLKEMPKIIDLADGIITVSEYSKKDIIRFFNVDENKIFSIPLAADSKYKPLNKFESSTLLSKTYDLNKPFILYIGGFSPRKNIKSLIKAFSKIYTSLNKEHDLVIVGANKDDASILKSLISELNIIENVKFTGFVPEEHLPLFYNSCSVFVYPSLYEGFGLPPLEAMSCGTAVITSNISSIPEVVKDGGLLIDPFDLESLMNNLTSLINNENIRCDLCEKALLRSSEFSWSRTAESTLTAYEKILNI